MRQQDFFYRFFLTRFVKAVVGVAEWKIRVLQDNFDPNNLCTPTDEAFALVYYENVHDRLLDIFKKNGNQPPNNRKKGRKRLYYSDVPTLYTEGGIMFKDPSKKQKSKGWSIDGLKRFNELVRKVREDRKKFPDFMKTVIESERNRLQPDDSAPTPSNKKQKEIILIENDLFLEDDHQFSESLNNNNAYLTENLNYTTLVSSHDDEPEPDQPESDGYGRIRNPTAV